MMTRCLTLRFCFILVIQLTLVRNDVTTGSTSATTTKMPQTPFVELTPTGQPVTEKPSTPGQGTVAGNDLTTAPIDNTTTGNATDLTNTTICFDVVGCFNNIPPNNNAGVLLPISPEKMQTEFVLYTRTNPDIGQQLDYTPGFNVTETYFSSGKPTKVISHGFAQNISTDWMAAMKDEFLKEADVNVILVGWGNGAIFPEYGLAVANTRMVATQLALLVQGLVDAGASLADMHFIGHSLGAHALGYTGMMFIGKVGRITGLEPAAPLFEGLDIDIRLDPSDAIFVDIIHTNAAPIGEGGLGMNGSVGHVDFYVNGGEHQPGCPNGLLGTLAELLEGKTKDAESAVSCSHGRSHKYFVESINSHCPFTAYPCDTKERFDQGLCLTCGTRGCSQMGYHSDQYKTRGKMFLNTASSDPFCGYHYFVQLDTNAIETKGKVWMRLNGTEADSSWFLATGGDVDLNPNKPFDYVAVSNAEVGRIETIELRYEKHHGFWFGSGNDKWEFSEVHVTSGESGASHYICEQGTKLYQLKDTEAEVFASSTAPC